MKKVVASISVAWTEKDLNETLESCVRPCPRKNEVVGAILNESSASRVYQKLKLGRDPLSLVKDKLGEVLFEIIEDMVLNRAPYDFDFRLVRDDRR